MNSSFFIRLFVIVFTSVWAVFRPYLIDLCIIIAMYLFYYLPKILIKMKSLLLREILSKLLLNVIELVFEEIVKAIKKPTYDGVELTSDCLDRDRIRETVLDSIFEEKNSKAT